MLARISAKDILSALSLEQRLDALKIEIAKHEGEVGTSAGVALIFDGGPVYGSATIEADFAGRALLNYQDMLTKQVAVASGALADRGPIPRDAQSAAQMHVAALVHGSFGFVLQEAKSEEPGFFDSPVKSAVVEVSNLLRDISSDDRALFEKKLDDLDVRLFNALKKFVDGLYKSKATLRVAEKDREIQLDLVKVSRAYERLRDAAISEMEETVVGELLGLVPIQRRFEFRRSDNGAIVQGRVSQILSADYLERLERDGLVAGKAWKAKISTKTVEHPDGRHVTQTHLLIDLVQA
jgi:hypothetical protein